MSAADPEAPVPAVPSVLRLAWLLFMQPLTLERMCMKWGYIGPTLSELWTVWRGDGRECELTRKLLAIAFFLPITSLILVVVCQIGGRPDAAIIVASLWFGALLAVAMGQSSSLVEGVWIGTGFGAAFAAVVGVSNLVTVQSPGEPLTVDYLAAATVAGSAVLAMLGFFLPTDRSRFRDVGRGRIYLARSALVIGMAGVGGLQLGGITGAILGMLVVASIVVRLPAFVIGSLVTQRVAAAARHPERGPRMARWLPYRHHDLIHFPLPGLTRAFIELAEHSPNLARDLITEAFATIAQRGPAQRAFDELQARAVRQAAEASAWLRIIELRGNFFPVMDYLRPEDPLLKFIAAATDLHAAETGGSQHRRRGLLEKASKQIEDIKKSYLAAPTHDRRATLLYDVAGAWSQTIVARREALIREIEENPEIPNVFVVGPPLNPGDPEALQLFRARRDLITIIERDLDDSQRGVIFLVGQRRMGKTSLLAMLPTYLGTATTIVTCDFQGLSGSEHGRAPHRWVVQELAAALARIPGLDLPEPAVTDAWGSALTWLTAVDAELARIDHRALVAIDEVERLQDAANEGWGTLTFLDFVRAAGDRLRRIRLLLVSAHPLANPKLGRAWVDRLISVLPRTLGPLDPDDAEALLCRPVPTFPPDVFDEAAAQTILAQTGRHPFLIQAVGKELVQRLLKDRRRAATAHDVERALDGVVKIAESALFTYLWDAFEPGERDVMRALAGGAPVDHETGTFRVLREQWFVDMHDGEPVVAFPLFARWIRDYRGEQPAA